MTSRKSVVHWLILPGIFVAASSMIAAELPSPALLVVIKDENALAIVDPAAKKIVGRIPVGEQPHEVTVSSDGKLAFVSNHGFLTPGAVPGRTLSVIDVAAQKELRRVDLGDQTRPHGLFYAGGKLYFTAEGNKLIGRYDPASNQIDWRLGTGQNRTHLVILSKDMNRIFTSNVESDTISAIERAPEPLFWNETVIKVGRRPEGMDMSPDEKEIWTGHLGDGGISIIDVASKKVIQTLTLGLMHPIRVKFTPDGKRVLISDDRANTLLMVDAAERKEIKRMTPGKGPEDILIAPDGSYAYVSVGKDNNIAVVDLKTLELAGRIPTGTQPGCMAWLGKR